MNNIIEQMLSKYEIKNTNDEINALKEIIQEIILSGLARGNFFDEAAFYGGTALRIFYKLDRFSEDLDFALIYPNKNFDLSKYFVYLEKELKAYGLNLEINTKQKNIESNITSAFVKGDTLEHILKFFPNEENHKYNHMLKNINKNLSIYCKDRHDIKELYCKGIEYEDLNNLSKYDIIINTVDFNLIKGSMFSDLKYQVKLYDIASYPYGFSLDDASNYHFKVEILPKLPSLVPREAGQVLYLTIKKMI